MNTHRLPILAVALTALLAACGGGGGSGGGSLPSSGAGNPPPTATPVPTPTPNTLAVTEWGNGGSFASVVTVKVSLPVAPAPGDLIVVAAWNNGQLQGSPNPYTPPDSSWNLVDSNTTWPFTTYQLFTHVVQAGEVYPYVFVPAALVRQNAWIAADLTHASSTIDGAANAFVNVDTTYATPSLTPTNSSDLAMVFNMPFTLVYPQWTSDPAWTVGVSQSAVWDGEALTRLLTDTSPVSETSTLGAAKYGFSAILLIKPSGT